MVTDLFYYIPIIEFIHSDFMEYTINDQRKKIKFSGTVQQLLNKLGISEQIVIVKLNGEIVTELDNIGSNDKVEIQKVILGG